MRKFVVAFLGTALLASTAMAGFTVTDAGPYDSNGPYPSELNGVFTFEYTGPDFDFGDVVFSGDLTSGDIGSYLSEARINITDPLGSTAGWSPASGTTWTGTHSIVDQVVTGGGAFWTGTAGTWTFEFSETYNDGGDDVDAVWTNLSFEFQDYVPPTAPEATEVGVPSFSTGTLEPAEIHWYTFDLASYTDDFSVDTLDCAIDTELGLYDADGTLLATNDDWSGRVLQSRIEMALDAGTYYVAVGKYNSTFADGWAASSTASSGGDYTLNIVPEPASLLLLAIGALVIRRR